MDEEVAHRDVGVAEVGAEDVFTEEFGEFATGGMTAEEGAALVARAVELGVTLRDVFLEGAEERGKNLIFILLGGGVDLTAEESEVVGIAVDDAHDAADEFGREAFAGLEHGEDGDPEREFLDLFELAAERFGGGHHGGGNRREVGALEVDDRAFGAEGVAGFVGGGDKELTHFVILTEKFGFGA